MVGQDLPERAVEDVQQITEVHGQPVVGTPKTKRGACVVPIDPEAVALNILAVAGERSSEGRSSLT